MAKKNIELQMKIAADVAEVKKATAEINTLAGAAKQCANIWGDNAELVR